MSQIFISQQAHPEDSSVVTVVSDKFKGDGFYGRSDGLHTVQYDVDQVYGNLTIQGTLAANPAESDWTTIEDSRLGDTLFSTKFTGSYYRNFTGNFVWLRFRAQHTAGTIQTVLVNN